MAATMYNGVNIGDRTAVTKEIKRLLKTRSGLNWSVTGGNGTAYGWLSIRAPKSTDNPYGYLSDILAARLAKLLGLSRPCHFQGEDVPSGLNFYREYLDRAAGKNPTVCGDRSSWD